MSEPRDKRAKFVELANKRVTKALREIRLIGNLSNRSAYEYTDQDAKKILRVLQRELDTLRTRFGDGGNSGSVDFNIEA